MYPFIEFWGKQHNHVPTHCRGLNIARVLYVEHKRSHPKNMEDYYVVEAFPTSQTSTPELKSVIVGVTPIPPSKSSTVHDTFLLEYMMSSLVSMTLIPPNLEIQSLTIPF